MRIAHLISYFDEKTSYEEVVTSRLQSRNTDNDVYVITSKYTNKNVSNCRVRKIGSCQLDNNLTLISLKSFLIKNDFILLIGLFFKLLKIKPDIVHAHGLYQPSNLICFIYSKILKFKLVYDHHDYFFPTHIFNYKGNSFFKKASRFYYIYVLSPLIKSIVNANKAVVAIDKKSYEHLQDWFKIKKKYIYLNELCTDTSNFNYISDNRYNIDLNEVNFLLTGIINRRKMYEKVIKPFTNHTNVKLYILGGGDNEYEDELRSTFNKYSNVIFLGEVKNEELKYYYSFMDYSLFIFNASISILETMACGVLPIYMSDLQFKEALSKGIKLNKLDDLDNFISMGLNKIDLKKRQTIIDYIENNFSYKKFTKYLDEVYASQLQ
jgi:hypothetical protein